MEFLDSLSVIGYRCSWLINSAIGVRTGVEQMVGRRVLAKLTVKAVTNLKRPGRTPAGTKNYAFLYCREGRSHEMGLGSVVTTTLVDARQKAAQCRALLAQGIDPLETRQSGVEARKKRRAFGECAAKLIAAKRPAWRQGSGRRRLELAV
jgi:hypothetical protein